MDLAVLLPCHYLEVICKMLYAGNLQKFVHKRCLCASLLIGSFIFAFLNGVIIAYNCPALYATLVCNVTTAPTSFGVLLGIVLIPYSITAILINANRAELFHILCFEQAFSYGIITASIFFVYHSAYWIVDSTLLFTATITLISLMWFWLRNISCLSKSVSSEFTTCLLIALSASIIDHLIVSPFFTSFTI